MVVVVPSRHTASAHGSSASVAVSPGSVAAVPVPRVVVSPMAAQHAALTPCVPGKVLFPEPGRRRETKARWARRSVASAREPACRLQREIARIPQPRHDPRPVSTRTRHGCMLLPDGARPAIARIRSMVARGTSAGRSALTGATSTPSRVPPGMPCLQGTARHGGVRCAAQ